MEQFIKIFNVDPDRSYPNRIEYRRIGDIDNAISLARNIISVHDLPLRVVTSHGLAQMKGFQVEKI